MCVLTQRKMNSVLSKSAVVRARHLPDVKGVNRYKYFHRPLIPDEVGVVCGESIDSKKVPQRAEILPPIRARHQPAMGGVSSHKCFHRATATVGFEKTNALSANKPSNASTKKKNQNGDTESPPSKVKRSKQKQIQELSAINLNAVASSSILPPIPTNKNVKLCGTKRLNATWPSNEESVPNGQTYGAKISNGAFAETGLARAQSVSSLRTTDLAFLGKTAPRSSSSWSHRQKVPIKDFGTQTDNSGAQLTAFSTPTIVAPEPLQIDENRNNAPKATQTNNLAVLTRLSIHSIQTVDDIEQRSKLLEIVDEALDQTIDKNSRQRVNELIASSARKQVEVWRDAKDFVSSVLLPQSVAIANRARSGRSPMDAIANVNFP